MLCSVLTAIVIAVMVHPASILGKFWGLAPFVWIGKRSYGIYLWHYPLLLLIVPQNGFDKTWWILLIALAVIFVVSAFSYTFVENPIRHGAIGRFFKDLANRRITVKQWVKTHIAYVAATVVLVLTAIGGLIFVPNTSALEGADLLKDASLMVPSIPRLIGASRKARASTRTTSTKALWATWWYSHSASMPAPPLTAK